MIADYFFLCSSINVSSIFYVYYVRVFNVKVHWDTFDFDVGTYNF